MTRPRTGDDPVALWASARVTELLEDQDAKVLLPKYGSMAWRRLDSGDPRKAAATITAAEMWRRFGGEFDVEAWLQDGYGSREPLASRKTTAELDAAARPKPAHQLCAVAGWPPVAVPGRPGWWRHYGPAGEQVDLPHNNRSGAVAA